MKKLYLLSILMLLPLMASAQTVVIDDICYNLDPQAKVAEIVQTYPFKYEGDVVIPESVTFGDITYSVTSIGEGAFYECASMTSVVIPSSVTSVAHYLFSGCENLSSVVVDAANQKYDSRDGCNAIIETETNTLVAGCKNTVIPKSVTSIGYSAFSGCLGLKEMIIPDNITSIGLAAFENCTSLTSVVIPGSVTSIEESAFAICSSLLSVSIPNSVTSLKYNVFYHCDALTSINIPSSVTSISDFVFECCENLASIVVEEGNTKYDSRDNCNAIIVTETNTLFAGCKNTVIPKSVTSIAINAFYGCLGLKEITIPNSVTTIGQNAFENCPSLTSIVIPSSVVSIGFRLFAGCGSLSSIIVDAGNTKYDSRDNCNAIIETATNRLIVGCNNSVIPKSVTSIGHSAFYGCFGLKEIVIPDNVTSIGSCAFEWTGLTSVTIPSSVNSIGQHAFGKCDGIEDVYCYAIDVPKADIEAFDEYEIGKAATLHVPGGSVGAYKTAEPWKYFKDIVAIEGTETTEDEIKITSAGQTTWCSGYDLDFTGIEGLKAYIASGYDRETGTIWLTRVNKVPAGEGILLMGNESTYKIPHKSTTTYYANLMVGTLRAITINEMDGEYTNYYLSSGDYGVGFYKVNGSVDLKPNRAYLPLKKGTTQAGTRFIGLGFEDGLDGTTDIETNNREPITNNREPITNNLWYNLQGQRVEKPTKGFYIRNGKKVVIK